MLEESIKPSLTKYTDPNKYRYSGYGTGSDAFSQFSLSIGEWGTNVVIFGMYPSLSLHTDNRKKDILVLGESQQTD